MIVEAMVANALDRVIAAALGQEEKVGLRVGPGWTGGVGNARTKV